jgi:predicted nucleic acid-binding protein
LLEYLTFDTEPILIFFKDEPGAKQVTNLFKKILTNDVVGYINIVNLTEVYYAIAKIDLKAAEEKRKTLIQYGFKVVSAEYNGLWCTAALLKNKYQLSLGDAFAVATAQALKTKLVVGGDKKLQNVPVPLLKIKE